MRRVFCLAIAKAMAPTIKYSAILVVIAAFVLGIAKLTPSKKDDVIARVLYKVALALNGSKAEE